MTDNNSNDSIDQTLNSIVKHQSFVSLTKFLQNYDLQEQNDELEQNEFNELCNYVNSFRGACESATSKLDSSNPLANVLNLLLNAYSFQFNQAEMLNERLIEENEQLKSTPTTNDKDIEQLLTEISDLKNQLAQAKLTISNYEAEEDAKERAIDNVIQSISDSFNLPSCPEDADQLIDELHHIIDENQGTIKNIIKTFDLPKETTTKDIIYHLKEKINEINSSALTEKLREQLLNTTNELEDAKKEIKRLQGDDQTQEPKKEGSTNSKNNDNQSKSKSQNQNQNQSTPNEKQILSCFEDIPLNSSEIQSIIQSDIPLLDKLKQIASALSLSAFSNESLQEEKTMLLSVISAQYKFIKSLADSEKVYANIYASNENPFEEIRQTLLAETESVHLFLQQHAIGIVEDSCLFEELLKREDSDLLDNVQKYLVSYSKPSSIESEELFIMLLQAVSAADVLRKYSSQLQIFNRQHEKDFKQMKSYSEQLEKSIDALNNSSIFMDRTGTIDPNANNNNANTNENMTRTTISTMSPTSAPTPKNNTRSSPKSSTKQTPRSAANPTQSNRSNFSEEQSATSKQDNDYVKNLKKQITDLRKSNNELKEERDQIKKQTHSDLLIVQEQIDKMKEKYNQKLSQKNSYIQKLSTALKDSTQQVKELREENEDLQQRIEKMRSRSVPEDNGSNLFIRDIQEQYEGAKRDFENIKSQMSKEISEYKAQKQNEFNEAMAEKENQIHDLEEQLDQSMNNSKKISKRAQRLEAELKEANNKIQNLERSEGNSLNQADQLGKKYREILDDLTKLEQTNEKLRNEIETSKDIHKRDKELLKTKYEHKLNELKIDHQADLNKLTDEKNEENQKILLDFAHAFPSYVDLSTPVTRDSINKAIQKVKKACQSDTKLEKKREILSNAKKSLKVEKDIEIPGAITTLVKKYDDILNEAQTLSDGMNEYMQMQEWLNRVYVLCTGGVCQDVTNAEMERCVEEALVNAFGSTILSRKVAVLRAEKKLLTKNVLNTNDEKKHKMSLRHLLIIAMLVLKAKTLSGHSDAKNYSFVNTDTMPVEDRNKNNNNNNNTSNRVETQQQAAPMSSFIYSVD